MIGVSSVTRIDHDTVATPAPGDLELVRSFLSLHDHLDDPEVSLSPSPQTLDAFLREHDLLGRRERATDAQLASGLRVHAALHRMVDPAGQPPKEDVREIERASVEAGLRPVFGGDGPRLEPTRAGVPGAIGRILATAFLAQVDGSWRRLKVCASDTCTAVFFDRSKNRSGRWCSMQSCGNRSKVRAWRDRHRGVDADA